MQFMPFLIVLFADVLTSPPPKSLLFICSTNTCAFKHKLIIFGTYLSQPTLTLNGISTYIMVELVLKSKYPNNII